MNRNVLKVMNAKQMAMTCQSQAVNIYERLKGLKWSLTDPAAIEALDSASKPLQQALGSFSYY